MLGNVLTLGVSPTRKTVPLQNKLYCIFFSAVSPELKEVVYQTTPQRTDSMYITTEV